MSYQAPPPAVTNDALALPPGFAPFQPVGGPFMDTNGPLYLLHQGEVIKFGFRVELRHTNPMGHLHGGMMASFCDILLPLSAHRKVDTLAHCFLPTISLQIDYLAPATLGRTLVFAQGLVTADGVPCARTSGVFKIGKPFHR